MSFYDKTIKEAIKELNSSENGLTEKEAQERLKKYGLNKLVEIKKISALKIFFSQFKSLIILILVIATIISLAIGEFIDAMLIFIILILNAILGFVQEYKAEKTIALLKKLTTPNTIVLRKGHKKIVSSEEIVPGDIILIETGNITPADAKLIECYNLKVNESNLTGESVPVEKNTALIKTEKNLIQEQTNMIFSSTTAVYGRAKAIVTATGMNTELGKIAYKIQEVKPEATPLQKSLKQLGIFISISVVLISILIFIFGLIRGLNINEIFLASISLAVAAIPEGLPAVVTICLALGLQRMVKRNVLIRKLPAVETLGSVDYICADKTGTLTCNEMTVKEIYCNDKKIVVTGEGYNTEGMFLHKNKTIDPKEFARLFEIAIHCNNADVEDEIKGDPTEVALLIAAKKTKLEFESYPRIQEIPFSSEKKYMATVNKVKNKEIFYIKGAPEIIIGMCSHYYDSGRIKWLTPQEKEKILKINEELASRALRVIGFAYKEIEKSKVKAEKLIFAGLMGMIDPPRAEVKDSIEQCKKAGIKVIMITGDHELTAKAIAREIGIIDTIDSKVINGSELDDLSDKKLKTIVENIVIYARVSPLHKLRILNALKSKGHIVAMTGDGINDAIALKRADIGIAVNKGTDVAKDASNMVLLDNNFASIVNAVEEGRSIYANIKKFINYLFSCNLGEVLTIFIAILLNLSLPLIAVQILFMNLITDGLPALALSTEPVERNIMLKPPRKLSERIIKRKNLFDIIFVSVVMAIGTLVLFNFYRNNYGLRYAQTVAFTILVIFQMFTALNFKTDESLFKNKNLFSNKKLIYAILSSMALQIIIIYVLTDLFKVVQLIALDWIKIILVSSSIIIFVEIKKYLTKSNNQ